MNYIEEYEKRGNKTNEQKENITKAKSRGGIAMISAPVLLCYTIINLFPILIRSVLFEKTALRNGDCRLTGRFADD